jgi:hypothetical protein
VNIKPLTVDTVYEAVKSFIATNSILKQVIEDELCGEFETITSVRESCEDYLEFTVDGYDCFTYRAVVVSKLEIVELINNFIA